MALIKKTFVDEITVTENGVVLVREATQVMDGDHEISRTFHRTSYLPGSDVSQADQQVQSICAAAWTPEVIEKYKQANQ